MDELLDRQVDDLDALWRAWLGGKLTGHSAASGTITQVTYCKIRLMPSISSERTSPNRRASAASLRAYAPAPTSVA